MPYAMHHDSKLIHVMYIPTPARTPLRPATHIDMLGVSVTP